MAARVRALVVSDLHLEKGSSFAASGQFLPPYDTAATLAVLAGLMGRLKPECVVSLGDSFHDRRAEARLCAKDAATIRRLTAMTDWIWVEGNHDPMPPLRLGGRGTHELQLSGLTFRHEPTGASGEVAGHFHPCAKIKGRGRAVRAKCFATDGQSLIMPALGAYTGGLNVCDPAFDEMFARRMTALVWDSRAFMQSSVNLSYRMATGERIGDCRANPLRTKSNCSGSRPACRKPARSGSYLLNADIR